MNISKNGYLHLFICLLNNANHGLNC